MNDPGGMFCVLRASVRQVPAVCRWAFGSFCRALVVAHMANAETSSSPFAKHMRRIACTLRIGIVLFGYVRLALKPPIQVEQFPNKFAYFISGYMMPTADHVVRAHNRAMLLRGCARVCMRMC